MSDLGHNGGPPLDPLAAHDAAICDLFDQANGLDAITTPEQEAQADELLDDLRKAAKAADAARADEKRPHDDAGKAVQAKWKPLLSRTDVAIAAVKAKLTPYRIELQRLADIEAARLRQIADDAAQRALEAKQSDDLDVALSVEEELQAARFATIKANKIDRAATGLRTSWTAEVTDRRAALNHYIKTAPEAFEALIQDLASKDARGNRPVVPGVTYHEQRKAA